MDTNITNNVKPWIWQTLGILLILFLALNVLDKIHSVSENFKSTLQKNTISMSAEGKVSATPDLAMINVGVTSSASTAKAAQDDMSKKLNLITDFVKQQGIDPKDITTTNFSVYPAYDYTKGNNQITGYQGSETISVKVHGVDKSTDKVSNILDGSVINGSNQIQGVMFSFDDPNNLKQQARKQAIDNAKQKAQELADVAGLKLGKVVSLSDNTVNYPTPIPYMAGGLGAAPDVKSVAPNIQAGSQDITASITITFEVK